MKFFVKFTVSSKFEATSIDEARDIVYNAYASVDFPGDEKIKVSGIRLEAVESKNDEEKPRIVVVGRKQRAEAPEQSDLEF